MNNTLRLIIGLVLAGCLAALAAPEVSKQLPPYVSIGLAAAMAEVLRRLNAQAPSDDPK